MTVTLSIKVVPQRLAALLRERARRNHRSLQGELMAIIEAAANDCAEAASAPRATGAVVGFDRRGRPIVRKGSRSIEDIAAELRKRTPAPRHDLPRSVDIVRETRDVR